MMQDLARPNGLFAALASWSSANNCGMLNPGADTPPACTNVRRPILVGILRGDPIIFCDPIIERPRHKRTERGFHSNKLWRALPKLPHDRGCAKAVLWLRHVMPYRFNHAPSGDDQTNH